jgi:hypothetical protein
MDTEHSNKILLFITVDDVQFEAMEKIAEN